VTRLGNIIENRGGIFSWLHDQILGQALVRLPARSAKAFHLPKKEAARSVLQALATGSRVSPGGVLLTSEPGVCLEFTEVARKIANFYGLKLGEDIAVRFGAIKDTMLADEPEMTIGPGFPGDKPASDFIKCGPGLERAESMIEALLSGDPRHLSHHDWFRRTEEIVSLCGPFFFSQKKALFIN
jgi:hypothetical protein